MARSQADVFLEAILDNPDDDTPRLVYADWLDERGDPASAARAEFIRVQCALARGPLSHPRRAELQMRQIELMQEHCENWARPIRRLIHTCTFHRGFIGEVWLPGRDFLTNAARLFRRAPIQHVRFYQAGFPSSGPAFSVPELASSEHLQRLRSLDLSHNRMESDDVRALVVSEHLTALTSLSLESNRVGDRGIRALVEAPLLARLTHLDLSRNDFGPSGVRALLGALVKLNRSADGLHMRKVNLAGNNLGTAGQRLIAEYPVLRRVVCLKVRR